MTTWALQYQECPQISTQGQACVLIMNLYEKYFLILVLCIFELIFNLCLKYISEYITYVNVCICYKQNSAK